MVYSSPLRKRFRAAQAAAGAWRCVVVNPPATTRILGGMAGARGGRRGEEGRRLLWKESDRAATIDLSGVASADALRELDDDAGDRRAAVIDDIPVLVERVEQLSAL